MTSTRIEAALARREQSGSLVDLPRQRRSAETRSLAPIPASSVRALSRLSSVQLRAVDDGSSVRFEGIASATERGYDMFDAFGVYKEIVSSGSFTETLATPDLDVPLVLGHDQLRVIARTMNGTLGLAEIGEGLRVQADLDPTEHDSAYIIPKLRSGLINEMSFAFRITAGEWSPDFTEYRISAVDIQRGDVAIVGHGANPYTSALVRKTSEQLARTASDAEVAEMLAAWQAESERRHPAPTMSRAQLAALDARAIRA